MNIRRLISYLLVAVLAAVIWTTWVKENPKKPSTPAPASSQSAAATSNNSDSDDTSFVPGTFNPNKKASNDVKAQAKQASAKLPASVSSGGNAITVKTDVLNASINLKGGNLSLVSLPKYPVSVKEKGTPMQIISNTGNKLYVAQSGLTNTDSAGKTAKIQFTSSQTSYVMPENEQTFVVSLKGSTANGLQVTKNYVFTRGAYSVKVSYTIKNTAAKAWEGSLYTQFIRRMPNTAHHMFYSRSYNGAAISSPSTPYEKLAYKDMDKSNLDRKSQGGWVAMQQHYFLSAWIPANQQQTNQFYSHVTNASSENPIYTLGFVGPQMTVQAGATATNGATIYVGPEIAKNLAKLAPGLDRTVDYGWLWWISVVIFWIMSGVHFVVGNWGWSIVITTILIKFVLYPLSATSFRSMARMRELQPRMKQLKEKFGDDRQGMSRATMELYKKEKINPLGGCLPMVIQIPVFIALYYVIIESVQLRQAPFIFWIHDLAIKDPYYVLPVLMGISMLIQQRLTPASPDPMQAKMMMIVPVVFTFFFLNFPAGLTLYWLVNNCVQIGQQWYVQKNMDAHMAKKAKRKKSKNKKTSIFKK